MTKSKTLTSNFTYNSSPKWYVIYIRSRAEKKVADRLERLKIECYLPLIKTVRQWSDRKKIVILPLFSGYLFVKTVPAKFVDIRMIEGVVKFVLQENTFATVNESQIEDIKRFISTGLPIEVSSGPFEAGEKVEITFGPLIGCSGELVEIKNSKQFIVRLEMINQALIVNLPSAYLKKN